MKKIGVNGRIGTFRLDNGERCTAYCRTIGKWEWNKPKSNDSEKPSNPEEMDLLTGGFNSAEGKDRGRALSIVRCNRDLGMGAGSQEEFEYVVLINGMRVENYSLRGSGNGWGLSNYANELNQRQGRYRLVNILVDNDAPLEEQTKALAKYVSAWMSSNNCTRVNVLGISKGGRMASKMLKFIPYSDDTKRKLNVSAYSMPGNGTIWASPEYLFDRLDEIVENVPVSLLYKILPWLKDYLNPKVPEDLIIEPNDGQEYKLKDLYNKRSLLVRIFKEIYMRVLSNSHMDFDIAIDKNGIPEEYRNPMFYDENYLEFDKDEINAINYFGFTNITTTCSNRTLRSALKPPFNPIAAALWLSSRTIFKDNEPNDGMVSLKSAHAIERQKGIQPYGESFTGGLRSVSIPDGHHSLGDDPELIKNAFDLMRIKEREPKETQENPRGIDQDVER